MLLTLKPPLHDGVSSPNAYSPKSSMPYYNTPQSAVARPDQPPPTPRSAGPQSAHPGPPPPPPPPPSSSAPPSSTTEQSMEVSHRNLPPMSSVNLPPPERLSGQAGAVSHLPPPPSQWQNADESMRQWLQAKVEEDRRRQEEERTRQETLRLDQRKIEQAMLRDSLQSGVPPHMVPFIFTGLGGGNQQLAQQFMAQSPAPGGQAYHHQVQPPQSSQTPQPAPGPQPQSHAQVSHARAQQSTGEFAGDTRTVPSNPYAAQSSAQSHAVQQQRPPSPHQGQYRLVSTAQPTAAATTAAASPAVPPGPQAGRLTHINTTEMPIYSPSPNTSVPSAASANSFASQNQRLSVTTKKELQQQDQNQQQLSPIHFYHWIPPNQSQPNTPAGRSPHTSPHSSNPASYLRSEYQNSPKKRKAQGAHQQAPPPPSQLSESTTQSRTRTGSTSAGRRNPGHARNQSQTLSSNHDSKPAARSASLGDHERGKSPSGRNGDYESTWADQAVEGTSRDTNKKDLETAQEWHKEYRDPSRDVEGDKLRRAHEDEKAEKNRTDPSSGTPASTSPNDSPYDRERHRARNSAHDNAPNTVKAMDGDVASEDGDRGTHSYADVSAANSDRAPRSPS